MQTYKYNLNSIQERKMLLIALVDAILAGFYLKIFPFDYTINLAVVVLPIYYFLDRRLHPVLTGIHIAAIGLVFRTLAGFYYYGSFINAFWADFNFLFFDLTYGIVFTLLFYNKKAKTQYTLFFAALASDFLGNAAEFTTRFGFGEYLSGDVMATLLAVALIRATVAVLLIAAIQYYNSFLRKEEHDLRYQKQIDMISELKGEIFFLKNNMAHVEQVMDEAFSLYREYEDLDCNSRKYKALSIAKNVHEVKKNYFRAVEGIDEIITSGQTEMVFDLREIVKMLQMTFERWLDREHIPISLKVSLQGTVQVKTHSMLMSILKNLVANALESIRADGEVSLLYYANESHHVFVVKDSGEGIAQGQLDYIFNPGYSTKYDADSGNSNRGVGLTIVKDIVENFYCGQISVSAAPTSGSQFEVKIPLDKL